MGYIIAFIAGGTVGLFAFALLYVASEEDDKHDEEPWHNEDNI